MADYTIKNMMEDVEDSAPRFGLSPPLEARFARRPLGCEQVAVAYERIEANSRMPFGHKHGRQEEIYVVVGGSGRVKIEDDIHDVRKWDTVRIGPDTMRNFEAGPEGLEVLAFGGPIGDDDSTVVQGWWSD